MSISIAIAHIQIQNYKFLAYLKHCSIGHEWKTKSLQNMYEDLNTHDIIFSVASLCNL